MSLPGGTFPHQKFMARCETLLLLDLHRAVKFHYEMRQPLDRYLGQDVFNSVLMGVRCHPAHRDILCATEGSSSGQMKTWSCSVSKWSLITYHTLQTVLRVHGVQQRLRQGPWSPGIYPPAKDGWMDVECAQQDDAYVCGKLCKHQGGEGSCGGSDGSSEEGVGDPPTESVNILRRGELCAVFLEGSEYVNLCTH